MGLRASQIIPPDNILYEFMNTVDIRIVLSGRSMTPAQYEPVSGIIPETHDSARTVESTSLLEEHHMAPVCLLAHTTQ